MLDENRNKSLRSSAPVEMPAVRMTIVGGRPPGCGRALGEIPRGVEVLVKKASVDPWFKALLVSQRAGAAEAIGLVLAPAEVALLNFIPVSQLEAVIASTKVEPSKVPAFLGRAAAVMLVALGASTAPAAPPQVAEFQGLRAKPATPVATAPAEATSQPTTQPAMPTTQPTTLPTSLPAETVGKIQKLVVQLDAQEYKQREDAQKQLVEMGPDIAPALLELARSGKQSLEVQSRLEAIVKALVDKLIGQMNFADPAHFDEPAQKLKAMGPGAVPYLRDAITKGKLAPASQQRVNWVIVALHGQPAYTQDQLRPMRGARAN